MNIKTLVITLVFTALVIAGVANILSGCSKNPTESKVVEETPSMFVKVESSSYWCVVYHRDTKVMYAVSTGYYNMGNFTLLVNSDGTPMLYKGE